MKQIRQIFFVVFIAIIIQNCKKDTEIIKNQGIIGKWKLSEQYDGYVNGGTFIWHNVSRNTVIEFTIENKYKRYADNQLTCQGTFVHLSDNQIEVTTSCTTNISTLKYSELTDTYIIFDYNVREGIVREKYIAIK